MKTPALNFLQDRKIPFTLYEYECQADHDFGRNAARMLNRPEEQVFKTILLEDGARRYITCVLPASGLISLKNVARILKVKQVRMCDQHTAQKVTGYVIGGISPFGQKKRTELLLDESAMGFDEILVSAGMRGLSVGIRPGDLSSSLGGIVCDLLDHGKDKG